MAKKAFYALGIHHSGPIASAAIVKDGKLIAGAPEERFSRIKQDSSFPHRAIKFCLDFCKINLEDIDVFAIGWNPGENVSLKYRAGSSAQMNYPGEWLASVPNQLLPLFKNNIIGTTSHFEANDKKDIKVEFVDHHTCHGRFGYEISGFEECALAVVDGWSEQKVTSLFYAKSGKLEMIKSEIFPNSLGCFYAALTDFLGYKVFSDEWKMMGMAAYGNPRKFSQINQLINLSDNGEYELDLAYFDFYNFDRPKFYAQKLEKLLGPARKPNEKLTPRHFDIAAAGQQLFERVMDNLLAFLYQKTDCDNIVLSGGVALNCLYNGAIVKRTNFSKCRIPFAPDDSGNSIGAAFAVTDKLGKKIDAVGQTSSIGIKFTNNEIGEILEKYKIRWRLLMDKPREVAALLAQNKVVGWFEGRSEFGQRALGHRSIFASPRKRAMKDNLNKMVKYREAYRPFAPMLPLEKFAKLFNTADREPVRYMEKAVKFKPAAAKKVPAVVHQDGTGRLQTVAKEEEPLLYKLLGEFESLTGIPVLLNTSFNLNGEPIVNSPEDALRTFMTSGLDALVLENYLIEKGKI